jgi:hypothetical protein
MSSLPRWNVLQWLLAIVLVFVYVALLGALWHTTPVLGIIGLIGGLWYFTRMVRRGQRRICLGCGTPAEEGWTVCPRCGHHFAADSTPLRKEGL